MFENRLAEERLDGRLEALEAAIRRLQEEHLRALAEIRRESRKTAASARRWQIAAVILAFCGLLLCPVLTRSGSAAAPDPKVKVLPIPKRVAALERAVFGVSPVPTGTVDRITTVQNSLTQEIAARQALANSFGTVQSTVSTLQSSVTTIQSNVNSALSTVASMQSTVTAHSAILAPFSTRFYNGTDASAGYDVFLTGANLHVINGMGATNGEPGDPADIADALSNGLGNIIIGYNEHFPIQEQGGSHNLVVGSGHSFASVGGLVAGLGNSITAPYATVTGGSANIASGPGATVAGGSQNIAVGEQSVTAGGFANVANGSLATVTGGFNNFASGQQSNVSGGYFNTANGLLSSLSGGLGLTSNAQYGWGAGGQNPSQPVNGVYPFFAGAFHSP